MEPTLAIRVNGLGRDYGSAVAVGELDLDVHAGEFFGFLGPNGAGKTTTIRMLTTLLTPTRGSAEVAGFDVLTEPLEVRRAIGVVFQETTLDLDLTAEENLRFCARLYRLSRNEATERIDEALSLFGLEARRRDRVRSFSGGMRRSLDLARGILHRPSILFLDEPTLGLDPPQRLRVWEHLRRLRDQHGTTLFLTTHYLDEADPCDRVAIIDQGALVRLGAPEALKRELGPDAVEVDADSTRISIEALAARVEELSGHVARPTRRGVSVVAGDVTEVLRSLVPLMGEGVAVHVRRPTLDDVFLEATRSRSGAIA